MPTSPVAQGGVFRAFGFIEAKAHDDLPGLLHRQQCGPSGPHQLWVGWSNGSLWAVLRHSKYCGLYVPPTSGASAEGIPKETCFGWF